MLYSLAKPMGQFCRVSLRALLAVLCLCWTPILHSQDSEARARVVQRYCHAPEIGSGREADERQRILARFDPVLIRIEARTNRPKNVMVAFVDSNEINAHTFHLSADDSVICMPVIMARVVSLNEGELAFILAHEFGHAYDDTCGTTEGRMQVAGGSRSPLAQQRACETRADTYGFDILVAAGYSPLDAAGAFGRLEMISGDTSTSLLARLGDILSIILLRRTEFLTCITC